MQLVKELISLDHHSFDRMEEYLACVNEIHMQLGKCGNNYQKKDGKHINLVLKNLRTTFDMSISTIFINSQERKEGCKDYNFEHFCGLLITNQQNLLKEGNFGGKNQSHFLKGE
jgi:hypothetical protein